MSRQPSPLALGTWFSFLGGVAIVLAYHRLVGSLFSSSPGDAYSLMPLFGGLGVLSAVLYRLLAGPLDFPRRGLGYVMGCLLGGSTSAALALLVTASDRPLLNQLAIALFGGVMLGGFFPWIGALLMHASRQHARQAA